MRTVGAVAGVALVAAVVAGCAFRGIGWASPDGPEFGEPEVRATYASGSATATITQGEATRTLTMSRLGPGARLQSLTGATVTWRTDDGWVLLLNAYDPSEYEPRGFSGAYVGDVTLQRIDGHEYWIAGGFSSEGNRCIVDIDELSETRLAGTATCRGLRWADGTTGFGFSNQYIEGQEPFDAELTFEATP